MKLVVGHRGFNEKVEVWRDSFNFSGKADYILVVKLRALKGNRRSGVRLLKVTWVFRSTMF